jgi:hypothetical protein
MGGNARAGFLSDLIRNESGAKNEQRRARKAERGAICFGGALLAYCAKLLARPPSPALARDPLAALGAKIWSVHPVNPRCQSHQAQSSVHHQK